MTLEIEITPEIEMRLESEARRSGMSQSEYARALIEEKLAPIEERPNYLPITPKFLGETKMRDFSGDNEWLAKHRQDYVGQYVALHGNRLIASGNSFKAVATAARDAGFKDALVVYVEDPNAPPYVGV
jgi:hypothetical protein